MRLFPEIRITGVIEFPEDEPQAQIEYRREGMVWTPDPTPALAAELDKALRRAIEAELELARMAQAMGFCPWPGGGSE